MKELDVDIYALQTADTADARKHFAKDWTARFLAVSLCLLFAGYILLVTILPHDRNTDAIINLILGSITGSFSTVIAFYFGSSRGRTDMKDRMKTSNEGIELIKHFKGRCLEAYLCPASVWTIGYGHTCDVGDTDVIDQEAAEAFLIEDLEEFEGYVNDMVEVPINQAQFDALVAWAFNLGPGNFKESTLLNRINYGPMSESPSRSALEQGRG